MGEEEMIFDPFVRLAEIANDKKKIKKMHLDRARLKTVLLFLEKQEECINGTLAWCGEHPEG
jgi:hypothetical protein